MMLPDGIKNAWVIIHNITSDIRMLTYKSLPETIYTWKEEVEIKDFLDELNRVIKKLKIAKEWAIEIKKYLKSHKDDL